LISFLLTTMALLNEAILIAELGARAHVEVSSACPNALHVTKDSPVTQTRGQTGSNGQFLVVLLMAGLLLVLDNTYDGVQWSC
jgi:hypothetical protein